MPTKKTNPGDPKPRPKRKRKPRPTPAKASPPPATAETMLDRARRTAQRAIDSLDDCVERVTRMVGEPGGEYNTQLASHLAYLTKHAVMLLAELRKLEAHDQRAVKAMTTEEKDRQVLEYVRDMARDRRAAVRAVLDELDAEQLLA